MLWIDYVIRTILAPRGYQLKGRMYYSGSYGEMVTVVEDNKVSAAELDPDQFEIEFEKNRYTMSFRIKEVEPTTMSRGYGLLDELVDGAAPDAPRPDFLDLLGRAGPEARGKLLDELLVAWVIAPETGAPMLVAWLEGARLGPVGDAASLMENVRTFIHDTELDEAQSQAILDLFGGKVQEKLVQDLPRETNSGPSQGN